MAPERRMAAGLFAAADVCYPGSGDARAAVVAADDARFSSVTWSRTAVSAVAAEYEPGEFWRRERPGLGARVYQEFGVPVIGVAKTIFHGAVHAAAVYRGRSTRPLYVTAAGISTGDAASMVAAMTGPYRIPDALRLADRLARGLEVPSGPERHEPVSGRRSA